MKNNNNNSFNLNKSKNHTTINLNKSKSFSNINNKKSNNFINKENLFNNNYFLSSKSQSLYNTLKSNNNIISKNNTFFNSNNFNTFDNSNINNKNTLTTFKYSFNNPTKIDLNKRTQTNSFYNSNSIDENNLIKNSYINETLKNTLFKSINIPKNKLTLSQSVINDQTKVINQLDFVPEDIKLETNPLKVIKDDRYSSYNIEYPPQYYFEVIKQNEPLKNKEWFICPHHIESFSNSNKAINDDILNTKYISYYGKPEINQQINNKKREEILDDLINETNNHVINLKNEMYNKSKLNLKNKKKYNELQNLKFEAQKNFIPGKVFEKEEKLKEFEEMIKDPNNIEDLNEMLAKKSGVQQHNFIIDMFDKVLNQLREEEKIILNKKRMEEFNRIGPPQQYWYNMKEKFFNKEFLKNELIINSGIEYPNKINDLIDKDLY
jgi:hypothetical protein